MEEQRKGKEDHTWQEEPCSSFREEIERKMERKRKKGKKMLALIELLISIFWVLDITNMPFMEIFDKVYPMNTLFWLLIFIVLPEPNVRIKKE